MKKFLSFLICGLLLISYQTASAQSSQENLRNFWIPKGTVINVEHSYGKSHMVVQADTSCDGKTDVEVLISWPSIASDIYMARKTFPDKHILVKHADIKCIGNIWVIVSDSAEISTKSRISRIR
jgi:hypothetical protein